MCVSCAACVHPLQPARGSSFRLPPPPELATSAEHVPLPLAAFAAFHGRWSTKKCGAQMKISKGTASTNESQGYPPHITAMRAVCWATAPLLLPQHHILRPAHTCGHGIAARSFEGCALCHAMSYANGAVKPAAGGVVHDLACLAVEADLHGAPHRRRTALSNLVAVVVAAARADAATAPSVVGLSAEGRGRSSACIRAVRCASARQAR